MGLRWKIRRVFQALSHPKEAARRVRTKQLAGLDLTALQSQLTKAPIHPDSFLFVTLDSCRVDTFQSASAPAIKSIGQFVEAESSATFTFASHCAMWVGMTPGVATSREKYMNPKAGRIFRLINSVAGGVHDDYIQLSGRTVIDGFRNLGYHTIGTGAMRWFDPQVTTGIYLTQDFNDFQYTGTDIEAQVAYVLSKMAENPGKKFMVFMNVGETHVPYYHKNAPWPKANPCVPFGKNNDREACQVRQRACLEFVDAHLGKVIDVFQRAEASILCCADHGDCHGEDGLWAHGFYHEKVMKVPLVMRLRPRTDLAKDRGNEGVGVDLEGAV